MGNIDIALPSHITLHPPGDDPSSGIPDEFTPQESRSVLKDKIEEIMSPHVLTVLPMSGTYGRKTISPITNIEPSMPVVSK